MQKKRRKKREKTHDLLSLQRGDIVLIRHKKGLFRYFLRRYMGKSYWDHTAMVLYPEDKDRERDFTIIAESIKRGTFGMFASRTVAVHRLNMYIDKPFLYDVGIKRVRGLTKAQKVLATHIMLMNVDAPYWNWKKIRIIIASLLPPVKKMMARRQRFSCSGIIQKAFYDAVPWEQKEKIVFKDGVWSPLELQELATPADLARSKNTTWIYNEH
jgi:hypothetical protein